MADSPIPDLVEPIIGWRAWDVRGDELFSVYQEQHWMPREAARAQCHSMRVRVKRAGGESSPSIVEPRHPAPREDCRCGIYATRTIEEAIAVAVLRNYVDVVGKVALWGTVFAGPKGWRAEFAYPVELWVVTGVPKVFSMHYIEDAYGVPIKRCESEELLELARPDRQGMIARAYRSRQTRRAPREY